MELFAKKRAIKVRDPLEPLLTFNWTVLRLVLILSVGGVITTLFGFGSTSFWGWGKLDICVTDNGVDGGGQQGASWFVKPHAGVSMGAQGLRLCTTSPTTAQRWWYTAEQLPASVTGLVVLVTVYVALRHARHHGPYTAGFAAKLRFLGWFLAVDSLLSPTIEVVSGRELWATMADGDRSFQWVPGWALLFAGLALVSLARIMAVGNAMREDLEGVV